MSKIISVSDDVYTRMRSMKMDKSFSELIMSLISSKGNKEKLLNFKGKDFIDENKIRELSKYWKKWKEKYV